MSKPRWPNASDSSYFPRVPFFVAFIVLVTGGTIGMLASGSARSQSIQLVQMESSGDENDVQPQEIEKYINVYKAMQKNRSLTADQAASQQGLSESEFRSLEDKIERNDAIRERVRTALRDAAKPSASPTAAK